MADLITFVQHSHRSHDTCTGTPIVEGPGTASDAIRLP